MDSTNNSSDTKRQRLMDCKKFLKFWIPVILWVGCIFWMSTETFTSTNTSRIIGPILRYLMPTISEKDIQLIHGIIRKLAHFTVYFILGLLLFRAFKNYIKDQQTLRWVSYSIIVVTLCALGDEFHQSFVKTRTSSLLDVGIDMLGGIAAQCTVSLRNRSSPTDSQHKL
jgi:VanZ family protein